MKLNSTHSVQELHDVNFGQAVAEGLTIVDFWAPWCGPCQMMGPVLEELADRYRVISIAKVNVDRNSALAEQFNVQAIPLLVFIRDGKEVDRLVGLQSIDQLAAVIKRHVG